MERRKAVIAAATSALTLLAAAVAISINSAIVDASNDGGTGGIRPVATQVTADEPAARDQPTLTVPGDEHEQDEHEYEGADDDD